MPRQNPAARRTAAPAPARTDAPAPPARRAAPPAQPQPRDLRQEILDTARGLLDQQGLAALSLREVARQAGVTHQAPYHHFGDRESILAELVTQGFDELARGLAAANDRAATEDEPAVLAASSEAYIGFALAQPGVFRVMFRPDLCDPARFPRLREAGARARAELARLVRILHGRQASAALASVYWAHVHGLACLLLDGPLAQQFATAAAQRAHVRDACGRFAQAMLRDR